MGEKIKKEKEKKCRERGGEKKEREKKKVVKYDDPNWTSSANQLINGVLAASPEEFSSGNSFPGSTPSAPRTQKERRFAPARTDPYVCGRAARHAPAARGVTEETETQRKGESEMGKAEQ